MFKKIIAYVGICLCVVLCFGMFFIKPVKAQMLSQGIDVNSQWFPSYIMSPIDVGLDNPLNISYPIELVKNDLTFGNELGQTGVFYLEQLNSYGGSVSYRTSTQVVNGYEIPILSINYFSPLNVNVFDVYPIVNTINIHFDQLILPTFDSTNYPLNIPYTDDLRYTFSIALPLYFTANVNGTDTDVILPKEDYVLDSCSFYRVGRDSQGNVVRILKTLDPNIDTPVSTDPLAVYYEEPSTDPNSFQYNTYFLGNILNYEYGGTPDVNFISFGDKFVLVEDFDLTIHLYANSFDDLWIESSSTDYPTFSITLPLVPIDNQRLSYTMEDYLDISNGFTFEMDVPEPIDMSQWLITSVGAFMNAELFPGFALGGLLAVIIAFPIVVWFLKILAGG